MIVLVTGGAGYIGSHLVRRLLGAGHEVRVLDRLDFGGSSLLGDCGCSGFSLIKGDVTDRVLLRRAGRGADMIVHLAARVGFPACQRDPQDAVRSNVEGTRLVLEELGAGQRLVFASTASVYGAADREQRDESSPVNPVSLYARTKVEAEGLVRARGDGVILRFATGFGGVPECASTCSRMTWSASSCEMAASTSTSRNSGDASSKWGILPLPCTMLSTTGIWSQAGHSMSATRP